ncbi:MAG: hypothetical protein GAK35_02320 [Herbaspirillum frisingense]|uniref:ASCH domain-containing protein n=1 Tax=Herbaspirillum frisingense TaxID=92645 RepID=A0A7V8FWC6_9BURK|nr:MAG: hypothetical protein GAK35_02320 [Herbaspirillum frisingense]
MPTVVLNFSQEFVPLVEAGFKPHTIRARRTDGRDPLPGDTLHLCCGQGTKNVRLLRREACEFSTEITIQQSAGNIHHVLLGGLPLSQLAIEQLALADGFPSGAEFVRYFEDRYALPFSGLLIGWAPTPTYVTRH